MRVKIWKVKIKNNFHQFYEYVPTHLHSYMIFFSFKRLKRHQQMNNNNFSYR
jgi:hypothetical protein